jgi:hypothetical protein
LAYKTTLRWAKILLMILQILLVAPLATQANCNSPLSITAFLLILLNILPWFMTFLA